MSRWCTAGDSEGVSGMRGGSDVVLWVAGVWAVVVWAGGWASGEVS